MESKTLSSPSPEASNSQSTANPPVKKRNTTYFMGQMGREMIPVIAGILIALFINNWQQSYRDEKLLESTLQSLSEEFDKNTENIQSYLPRQTHFLDTLRLYHDDTTLSILDIATKTSGMGSPEIYATNWQLSVNNNSMRLLNFQTINLLSQIESKYQELRDQDRFLYPILYGPPVFQTGKEGAAYRRGMELWLNSYIGNEKELLALYEKFQKIIQDKEYH